MHTAAFPPTRLRGPAGPLPLAETYERIQSFGPSTQGDADAALGTFSGAPDSIVVSAQTNGALFRLTDRLDRELDVIHVPAGASVETHVRAERVYARNAVAGANALAAAHGKWAERAERSRGY